MIKILGKFVLALCSTILALLIGELLMRLALPNFQSSKFNPFYNVHEKWSLPDDELGFIRKPFIKWEGWAYNDPLAHFVNYESDENGFRNISGISKADIVFVGDSFTEAGNVAAESTFVQLTAKLTGLKAVNLGRSGYGPPQYLRVLKRYGASYSPRYVFFVVYEGNDLTDAEKFKDSGLLSKELQTRISGENSSLEAGAHSLKFRLLDMLYSFRIARMTRELISNQELKYAYRLRGVFRTDAGKEEGLDFNDSLMNGSIDKYPEGWAITRDAVIGAQQWSEDIGAEFFVSVLPVKLRVMGPYSNFNDQKNLIEYLAGEDINSTSSLSTAISDLCRKLKCQFIDPIAELRDVAKKGGLVYSARYDTHLDELGHGKVAQLYADILRRLRRD